MEQLNRESRDLFDVAIAGGGPAGAITALCLARRGKRVALFEATKFQGDRFGETLPPEINPVLRELEILESFLRLGPLEAPGIISSWGDNSPLEQDFLTNAHGCGWHVDRNRFDAMLCRQATDAGVTLFEGFRATPVLQCGVWRLGAVSATFLVDASGRNGMRLQADHAWQVDDTLLAVTARAEPDSRADLRTIIETTASGWWYSSPIPGNQLVAMFFTSPLVYREQGVELGQQLEVAPLTAARLEGTRIVSTRVVFAPSASRTVISGESWLAVGDSASCYDPLAGRGIFKAFRHGMAAAEAVVSGNTEAYQARVCHEFSEYSRQRREFYASERRWPNSPFWAARAG